MLDNRSLTGLFCLLLQLAACLNTDAERLRTAGDADSVPEAVERRDASEPRHRHRRRAAKHDDRYLGFQFTTEPASIIASTDSSALFHCAYRLQRSDSTDVRLEWRKDGATLGQGRSAGRTLLLANGSLSIEDAVPSDEGVYQCAVHVTQTSTGQTWTFISKRALLRLPTLPKFEHEPTSQKVFVGQRAAFRCLLDARPHATIEWLFNNRPVEEGDGVIFLPLTQTLEISNAQLRHAGAYKCVARNGSRSRASQAATLDVVEGSSGTSAISIVLDPLPQTVDAGGSLLLECSANGSPAPTIRWLHGSTAVAEDGARTKRVGADGTSLLIRNAQPSDAGSYTCRAENGDDSVDSSATVIVRVSPKITTVPKDELTQETADAEFECVVEGVPTPRVTWLKNGEVIIPSEYFVIGASKLRIFGLVKDDQGVYQCVADNDAGSAQASAQLLVDAADAEKGVAAASNGKPQLPLQPLGLHASNVGSRFVTLKWDPPLGQSGDILLYHVYYREDDSTRERTTNSSTTTATIAPLQPDSVYLIKVVAESHAGPGKASDEIRVQTGKEQAVPGQVRNLRATVLGSETIEVEWEPPAVAGPEPIRYKLFYSRANATDDEKETQILMVKTSYTLHGMEKNTFYSIRVEAEGPNGAGLSSDSLVVRTFTDIPSAAPVNLRADAVQTSAVRMRWQPPPLEERNGDITGYKIRYKTKQRGSKGSMVVVDGDPGEYTVHGLEAGTQYTFRMAALTQNGTGPFSDWISVDTPMEEREETQIAGAPSELRVHASHDSIQVAWLPPREDSVMIRGYQVGWGVNVPDVEKARVDADVREYTIKGLKPNREYVISLRAFNNVGPGFPIYETVKTTSYGYGSPSRSTFGASSGSAKTPMATPVGVNAEAVSSTAIRVTWTDPNEPFNQYYTIRYSSSGDNNDQMRHVNTSELEHIVDGLRPNTQYEFAVKLVDSDTWSMTAVNRTLAAPPSSAPRDLTVVPHSADEHEDPNTVTLNWQPPKYANGDIEEYIILYSDRLELPDKDWVMDSVRGDRLSIVVRNLQPKTAYYFKIQARNVKGYGPLSPVVTYTPGNVGFGPVGGRRMNIVDRQRPTSGLESEFVQLITSNLIYVIIGFISVIVLLLIVILSVICVQRKSSADKRRRQGGYIAGRKQSTGSGKNRQPDLWIQNGHAGGRGEFMETPGSTLHDMRRLAGAQMAVDSPPPRYQTLQQGNGTLTRSYHQSSTSLEAVRQRTPQVVYTGTTRQPIAKVEFSSDHGSSYGGSVTGLQMSNTPPPPTQAPPHIHDGYQTVRGGNPLRSFAQMGGAPPPAQHVQVEPRTAHIVRPVVVASPTLRTASAAGGRPGISSLSGQKAVSTGKLPVGLAVAQPRVNVAHAYAQYASVRTAHGDEVDGERDDSGSNSAHGDHKYDAEELKPLRPAISTEDFNVNEIDHMIDTLQQLQQEFTEK